MNRRSFFRAFTGVPVIGLAAAPSTPVTPKLCEVKAYQCANCKYHLAFASVGDGPQYLKCSNDRCPNYDIAMHVPDNKVGTVLVSEAYAAYIKAFERKRDLDRERRIQRHKEAIVRIAR